MVGFLVGLIVVALVVSMFWLAVRPGPLRPVRPELSLDRETKYTSNLDGTTLRVEVVYPDGSRTIYRALPATRTLLFLGPPDAFVCDVCGGETPMGAVHVCICPVCGRGVPMNLYDKTAGKCRICAGERRVAGEEKT